MTVSSSKSIYSKTHQLEFCIAVCSLLDEKYIYNTNYVFWLCVAPRLIFRNGPVMTILSSTLFHDNKCTG